MVAASHVSRPGHLRPYLGSLSGSRAGVVTANPEMNENDVR